MSNFYASNSYLYSVSYMLAMAFVYTYFQTKYITVKNVNSNESSNYLLPKLLNNFSVAYLIYMQT